MYDCCVLDVYFHTCSDLAMATHDDDAESTAEPTADTDGQVHDNAT